MAKVKLKHSRSALVGLALLVALGLWAVKENADSEKKADETVECINAGQSDC
jgi:hypothetical protein